MVVRKASKKKEDQHVKVSIKRLRGLMTKVAGNLGVPKKHIGLVIESCIRAEISGKTTHGIGKFLFESQFFKERIGLPKIIKNSGSFALVDSQKEIGQISAGFCVDLCLKKAKRYGIAIVGMSNSQRYGTLDLWSEKIAEEDLIGIVMNTCEPEMAVYGGVSKTLGTNPISYSIPTLEEPVTLDMATAKVAMSLMWERRRLNRSLPANTFFDENGKYTTDPFQAVAVEPFGGYKGFGVALLVQILTGSFLGLPMATEIKSLYDIGYLFIAIDPSVFQDVKDFKRQNSRLVQIVKSSKTRGSLKIKTPGERSRETRKKSLERGYMKIDSELYGKLVALSD